MVKKIFSGGQTGADRAALDVAIKLGIAHGGWIPKGRLTENGVLDDKYQLKEMETTHYNKRTEQNVIDSEGTLIISHGKLTGGSDYTRDMALRHNRPWLHIDLNKTMAFQAAKQIRSWLAEHEINVLNVAGPRTSKDPAIYNAATDILETAFYLDLIDTTMHNHITTSKRPYLETEIDGRPQTVGQAAEMLLSKLSLRDKTMVANIPENNLIDIFQSLKTSIKNEVRLWLTGESLLESCRSASGENHRDEHSAALSIIKALWEKLQKNNFLRIVK